MNLKKILLIVGLIAVTLALAFGLYWFFKSTGPITELPQGELPGGEDVTAGDQFSPSGERISTTSTQIEEPMTILPSAKDIETQGASVYQPEYSAPIVTEDVVDVAVSQIGDVRYYNETDGKFYKALPDGTTTALSERTFYNVQDTTWANRSDKAVIEYPDGSKILYNFSTDKQVSLPKHWEEFNFSPTDDKIAAKSLGLSEENRWLVTMNDDGTGTQLINALGGNADKVITSWSPNNHSVAFSLTGEALGAYREEVLFLGLHGENFKSFVAEGMDFRPKWSDTGNKLLYSVYSDRTDYKPEIWVVNANGSTIGSGRQSLEINTWAEKCSFATDDSLYCAIPRGLPTGAGISPEVANDTFDDIYRIDLKTGFKTAITTGGNYTVEDLQYDEATGRLIFTDTNKNGIYEINL